MKCSPKLIFGNGVVTTCCLKYLLKSIMNIHANELMAYTRNT